MADQQKIKIDPEDYLAPGEFSRIAAERFSKVPIKFTRLKDNTGEYPSYPSWNPLSPLQTKISQMMPSLGGPGVIKVDPYAAAAEGGIPTTIQHEASHAVANNLPGIEQISTGANKFDYLAAQLASRIGGGGDPAREVLAYANSNDPAVNKDWMAQYISDITNRLKEAGLGPQAATLSQIHQQGNTSPGSP